MASCTYLEKHVLLFRGLQLAVSLTSPICIERVPYKLIEAGMPTPILNF